MIWHRETLNPRGFSCRCCVVLWWCYLEWGGQRCPLSSLLLLLFRKVMAKKAVTGQRSTNHPGTTSSKNALALVPCTKRLRAVGPIGRLIVLRERVALSRLTTQSVVLKLACLTPYFMQHENAMLTPPWRRPTWRLARQPARSPVLCLGLTWAFPLPLSPPSRGTLGFASGEAAATAQHPPMPVAGRGQGPRGFGAHMPPSSTLAPPAAFGSEQRVEGQGEPLGGAASDWKTTATSLA